MIFLIELAILLVLLTTLSLLNETKNELPDYQVKIEKLQDK